MIEFLLGSPILILVAMGIIQISLLWAGQGTVETAAHFAARKFALSARTDLRRARTAALAEASAICLQRPGAKWGSAQLTSIDVSRDGKGTPAQAARPGEVFCLRLNHWFELCVPWVAKILYLAAPSGKTTIGGKYYLLLRTHRWVTVE